MITKMYKIHLKNIDLFKYTKRTNCVELFSDIKVLNTAKQTAKAKALEFPVLGISLENF